MKICFHFLALIVLAILTSSCVIISDPGYPESWPKPLVLSDGKCPDISGLYHDTNVKTGFDKWQRVERTMLSKLFVPDFSNYSIVWYTEIRQSPSNSLTITLWDDEKPIHQAKEKWLYDLKCKNGRIQLHSEKGLETDGVIYYGGKSLTISKTDDDSILVQESSGGVGLAMIIPAASYHKKIYLYMPASLNK